MPTKKSPKVAIVMSTYNGEKYLEAQLESLLRQTYRNIDIYVRDDGSTDGTLRILRQYAKENKNIHVEAGNNLGFAASFLRVLSSANNYDYYAFCDQDDVWLDFKIERAVKYLQQYSNDQPLLYGSSYDYYDAELNFREHANPPKRLGSFIVSTTECFTLGTCMVINNLTRKHLLRIDASKIYMHDHMTYKICVATGEIIYDPMPTIKYRRTSDNASPCGLPFLQLQVYRIKNFLFGPKLQKINQQNRHFAEVFYSELKPGDQKIARLFMSKNTLLKRLRKTFYLKRWRSDLFGEIALRFLFILGII